MSPSKAIDRLACVANEFIDQEAGRESLAVLTRHAEPTRLSKAILHELEEYWTNQSGQ